MSNPAWSAVPAIPIAAAVGIAAAPAFELLLDAVPPEALVGEGATVMPWFVPGLVAVTVTVAAMLEAEIWLYWVWVKPHSEEMDWRSGVTLLFCVMQMAHKLPMDLTSKDLLLQIQSDSCWTMLLAWVPLTLHVPESWTSGLQTDLHPSGTSPSVIPAAKLVWAKARRRLGRARRKRMLMVVRRENMSRWLSKQTRPDCQSFK